MWKKKRNRDQLPSYPSKRRVSISIFCILLENNLYCVIVRFGCIGVLVLSDFLSTIFLYSIFHSEFLRDCLRQWTYLTLREPLQSWCYLCVIVVALFNCNCDRVCFLHNTPLTATEPASLPNHPMITRLRDGTSRPKPFPNYKLYFFTKHPLLALHTTTIIADLPSAPTRFS